MPIATATFRKVQIAAHIKVCEESCILKKDSHRPSMRRKVNSGLAFEPHFSVESYVTGMRCLEASDRAQQGALATPTRPKDGGHPSRRQALVHPQRKILSRKVNLEM